MKQIVGQDSLLDISKLTKVCDLIYFEGPLLSHYVHISGDNYLSYWVDNDESDIRWLVFRVGITALQNYTQKKSSLYELILNTDEGFVNVVDINSDGNIAASRIVAVQDLPADYLPDSDSYYEPSMEREADTSSLSLANKCGIFEIHFSGSGVNYGNMPFSQYSELLQKVEDVRLCLAKKFIERIKRSESYNNQNAKQKKLSLTELRQNTTFQYLYSLAGSVRILLKPTSLEATFAETTADAFANELIRLLKSGYNESDLRKYATEYGQDALLKFEELLKALKKSNIDVEMSWTNSVANIYISQSINEKNRNLMLSNLSNSIENTEDLTMRGKFYSLNIKSARFSFESSGDNKETISGSFDDALTDKIRSLSFEQEYEIFVERKIRSGVAKKQEPKDVIYDINLV